MLSHIEVNLKNISENTKNLKNAIGKAKLMAVVKSNAYGHGLVEVAKTVVKAGADYLAVDNIEEGLALRKAKIKTPILVFGWPEPELIDKAVENDLTLTVFDKDTVRRISKAGMLFKKPAKVHVEIETGMNRYGLMPEGIIEFMNYLKHTPKVEIEGIYSHFASAQSRDKSYTFKQLGIFQKILENLRKEGYNIPLKHIANSAATLSMPSSHFDMVRLGICLYGLFPSQELGSFFELKPALEFKSKIVSLKEIAGSEKISYDGTYTTNGPTRIGVVPVGYADGYDRRLSNYAKVLVRGERAPVVGKICMRAFMINVSLIEGVEVGDEVVLIGKQGDEQITAGELSGLLGTINYEVVSRLSPDLPRVYIR
jgi:alanine racemase